MGLKSWATIQSIEYYRHDPRLTTIAQIAEALNVPISELLTEHNDESKT